MLTIEQLAVNYRNIRGLDHISFQVTPGQMVGIVGPNGAGKSTMLKAMLGLVPKAEGAVHYCTCPLHQQLQKVAYVPQRSQIDWDFPITVWNTVMMGRTRHLGWFHRPGQGTQAIVKQALERVEMDNLRDRRIGELSGGQQQRVFIARALAQQAEIFLFDEPFTGVDKKTELMMFDVFNELKKSGKIILISNHDWGQSLNQLDRLILLNRRLIADGTPLQVMTSENLCRAYGTNLQAAFKPDFDNDLFC